MVKLEFLLLKMANGKIAFLDLSNRHITLSVYTKIVIILKKVLNVDVSFSSVEDITLEMRMMKKINALTTSYMSPMGAQVKRIC